MSDKEFHKQAAILYREIALLHQLRAEALGHNYGRGAKTDGRGRIVGLKGMIMDELLKQPGRTSADLADTLYNDGLGVDRSRFRRLLIVALSHMHKQLGTIHGVYANGLREKLWYAGDAPLPSGSTNP